MIWTIRFRKDQIKNTGMSEKRTDDILLVKIKKIELSTNELITKMALNLIDMDDSDREGFYDCFKEEIESKIKEFQYNLFIDLEEDRIKEETYLSKVTK